MSKIDHTDFLHHYTPLHNSFVRYCRAISANSTDAQDLIQDTLVAIMEQFDKIKEPGAFKSYLYRVAGNLNKMKIRRMKFSADFNEDEMAHIHDSGIDAEQLTDYTIIYNKIMELPAKTAQAIILFHVNGMSLEDIREIQGGSLSGVKSRIKRGREKVLEQLSTPRQLQTAMIFFTL